jgi:soluble P-type ATPase
MIELTIPGRGLLRIAHLVTALNGTLAVDGILIDGLAKRLTSLRDRLEIHPLTADAHRLQAANDALLKLKAIRVQPEDEAMSKADLVRELGAETVVAIGQSARDTEMLKVATLGICVMSEEGVAVESLLSADLVMPDIFAALDLLDKPLRIITSLRK